MNCFLPYAHVANDGILMQAIKAMQVDSAFSLTSENCALQIAAKLSEWIPLNLSQVDAFEQKVCMLFKGCISGGTKNAVMWTKYHTLRTSDEFLQVWNSFIQTSTQCKPLPMFIQYVGHHIFKGIIKATLMPLNKSNAMSSSDDLTYAETNAICYAAGYVPRALKK